MCGAITISSGLNTNVFVNGVLAAVVGDIDTHPGIPSNVTNALMGLGSGSPISALSALSGFTGLPSGVLGGLSFGSALSGLSSLQGVAGFASMVGGMGVNIGSFTGAMSSLGVPIENMANIESGAGSISAAISSISGASLGSLASGGLSNIASLSGIGSIAGIGSVQNYLNAAQGILGAGGSLSNLASAFGAVSGLSSGPGALISLSPGTIKIGPAMIPMISSIMDQSAPDVIGLITHVTGLPTPGTGSPNVNMYTGNFAGGLGMFGLSGVPAIGELMSFAGNIVGQVYRTANQGSNSGMLAMNNTTANTQPTTGSTVTGVTTGRTFTFSSYYTS